MPEAADGGQTVVSVVVPTHDTRELTLACLASLQRARPAPSEVVVVDDGSADGTAEAVAAAFPFVRLVRQTPARGFTVAANTGLALARGDVLLLLNSDTEVAEDAVGALLAAFVADPLLGVAGAALYYPDGAPQWSGGPLPDGRWLLALASGLPRRLGALLPWRRWRPVSGHEKSSARLSPGAREGAREVGWVTGAAMAIRRAAWEAAGPLDPRFALYCQDLDFCAQAGDAGWRVALVPGCRVMHHHGATIGAAAGVNAARHNAPALWADLVRWADKRGGPAGARKAVRLLRTGAAVQRSVLAGERLLGAARRARAAAEGESLAVAERAAMAVLDGLQPGRADSDGARLAPPERS